MPGNMRYAPIYGSVTQIPGLCSAVMHTASPFREPDLPIPCHITFSTIENIICSHIREIWNVALPNLFLMLEYQAE